MSSPHHEQPDFADQLGAGLHVLHLPQVESTSTRLKELIVAGQVTGPTVLVTNHQTAGRGTRTRSWKSSAPEPTQAGARARDLALTFATPVHSALHPCLSLAIGALLADAIQRCTHLAIGVKWPNDLLAGEPPRKLGGVLLETTHGWVLVGVGVNVNSRPGDFPPDIAPQLTTLAHETQQDCDIAMLQLAVVRVLRQLPDVDIAKCLERFRELDRTAGTHYTLNVNGKPVLVVAEAVADDGALLLRDADGNGHRVAAFTDLEKAQ
jgi:BirA family biotin operon repressor/biotin-[acetyl-CoA-carboxylase] ligase